MYKVDTKLIKLFKKDCNYIQFFSSSIFNFNLRLDEENLEQSDNIMDNHNDLYRNTDLKTFANLPKKVFY